MKTEHHSSSTREATDTTQCAAPVIAARLCRAGRPVMSAHSLTVVSALRNSNVENPNAGNPNANAVANRNCTRHTRRKSLRA